MGDVSRHARGLAGQTLGMVDETWAHVDHLQVVEELKQIRERGVVRLRTVSAPMLQSIATRLYPGQEPARGIEVVLKEGLARMGEGETADLAAISFGLKPGLRGTRPPDLRRAAAVHRRVSPETFRKSDEPVVMADLAGAILAFAVEAETSRPLPRVVPATDSLAQPQAAALGTPEHDTDGRRHFVDPISMYPFIVNRAQALIQDDERSLDVMGLTLYTAWTSLKFWIMRPETANWCVRLAAVLDLNQAMSQWIPDVWRKEAEIHLHDIVETSQLKHVIARRIQLRPYAYDFVPMVHGYRLGNGDLFISFLKWQDDGRLGKEGYTYEFIPGTERSLSATAFRELYDSWFERATRQGQFYP